MIKDFDKWNSYKKQLEVKALIYCKIREIWWCSLGINVGSETCGKNELFERPVLILRIYSQQSILVAPITSKVKKDTFHQEIIFGDKRGWVILSHARTISPKRLQRKLTRLDECQFMATANRLMSIIEIPVCESAPVLPGASEPEGMIESVYAFNYYSQVDIDALHTVI
ncbi:MAG: type II toxin-antitoxin system PemK/MazF family toxin [Candidatus Taylorbacteria bacterium]